MAANMDTCGTFAVAEALAKHKVFTAVHKHYTYEEWVNWATNSGKDALPYVAISSGIQDKDLDKMAQVLEAVPEIAIIGLDVANGYSQGFVDVIRTVRERWPHKTLIAGNVVTKEMAEELIFSGADIVKVGIGPGSVCTTRKQTGVGYPQLSAILECADAAHGLQGRAMGDGGCTCPGDIAKAFGAGADFVMLGGMLAGHDECSGDVLEEDGRFYKIFYGMSSSTAMTKHAGGVAQYRSSEGKSVKVPYRGPIEATILDILGGLRSACTYVGAGELRELSKRTTFIRCTQQLNPVFPETQTIPTAKLEAKEKTETPESAC